MQALRQTDIRTFSNSLLCAIIACNHLPFFRIFSNFVNFCLNFQIFALFVKNCLHSKFLEYVLYIQPKSTTPLQNKRINRVHVLFFCKFQVFAVFKVHHLDTFWKCLKFDYSSFLMLIYQIPIKICISRGYNCYQKLLYIIFLDFLKIFNMGLRPA